MTASASIARRALPPDYTRRDSVLGRPITRWADPQQALFDSPYRYTLWLGANAQGKSVALAELCKRALAGELHWQTPGPHTVMLVGKTWS